MQIPNRRNALILISAGAVNAAALWAASHAAAWWQVALAALVFAFSNNTLFALLHEAVHGVLFTNRRFNRIGGIVAAAWFPTGFLVQRAFHLTHHRNNRTRFEQFDYIHDDDIKWLKYAQWYAILTGLYWAITVVGVALFALTPRLLRVKTLRRKDSQLATQTSSGPYLDAVDALPPLPARLELVFAAAWQLGLAWTLGLSWTGWLVCYAAFALNWSSLQYADHAFSPLDPKRGAWNLRVPRLVRWIFLNYHFHLAHHQHPQAPWTDLPRLVDPNEPQPSFFSIWRSMWAGPRPYPGDPERAEP